MTKQESDDAMKAAEYNIDTAFDLLRTALANPKGLEHIPNGAHVVAVPVDGEYPEVAFANRTLIDGLATREQQVVMLRVFTAQVTITSDGGLFIGQTYFTPAEATELGEMIQIADRPMPGTIGIESTPDGHVVALRPFFDGQAAKAVDHSEAPRADDDPRLHASTQTFEKLNGVVTSVPVRENRR